MGICFLLDWMRPCEAVVVCRIEPRKGDAGEIFRNFMELENILKILNIYRQYRIVDRVGIGIG